MVASARVFYPEGHELYDAPIDDPEFCENPALHQAGGSCFPEQCSTQPHPAGTTLLREDLQLTGTKEGCGACTVVLGEADHGSLRFRAVNSCIRLDHADLLQKLELIALTDIGPEPDSAYKSPTTPDALLRAPSSRPRWAICSRHCGGGTGSVMPGSAPLFFYPLIEGCQINANPFCVHSAINTPNSGA